MFLYLITKVLHGLPAWQSPQWFRVSVITITHRVSRSESVFGARCLQKWSSHEWTPNFRQAIGLISEKRN